MEFQFTLSVGGHPVASFDSETRLIGVWLTEEVGRNHNQLTELLKLIDELERGKHTEYRFEGSELGLYIDREEIEIYLLSARSREDGNIMAYDLPEGTEIDESAEGTGCGLADFKRILLSWQEFIS